MDSEKSLNDCLQEYGDVMYGGIVDESEVVSSIDLNKELSEARTNVVLASHLVSYPLFSCEVFFTDSPKNPTAVAVVEPDGNFILIDVDLWKALSLEQRAGVLYHEVLHVFLEHGLRGFEANYNKEIWGKAIDYYVNPVCLGHYKTKYGAVTKDDRIAKYLDLPDFALYDERFIGMSADEIYDILLQENESGESGGNGGEDQKPFDEVPVTMGDNGSQSQVFKNRQTMIGATKLAEDAGGIGDHELGVVRDVNALAVPVVTFRDHLTTFVKSKVPNMSTYSRYSRKSGTVVFPVLWGEHIEILFGIDTSGSMSGKDISRALGELVGIMDDLDSWKIHVVSCDTRPYYITTFSSEEHDVDDVKNIKLKGGGGTHLRGMLDSVEEIEYSDINAAIIVTDGHLLKEDIVKDEKQENFDILVVVTENGNKNFSVDDPDIDVIQIEKEANV